MTNSTEDLLKIIKEQHAQIKELLLQNGMLIAKVGTNNPPPNNPHPNNPPPFKLRPGQKAFYPGEYRYTGEDKVTARTLITAINTGTKEDATSANCMIYNKHSNTSRCYELEKNVGLRQRGWRTWFA